MRTKKLVLFVMCCGLSYYAGRVGYDYFFSKTAPLIHVANIEHGRYYKGNVTFPIILEDAFKVAELHIFLDGKETKKVKAHGRKFTYNYAIETKDLGDGQHDLEICAINGTYQQKSTRKKIIFNIDNKPLYASLLSDESEIKVLQGRTLHVKFQVNKAVRHADLQVFNQRYVCYPEINNALVYETFVPISCEERPEQHTFKLLLADFVDNQIQINHSFQVTLCQFKRQQLKVNSDHLKKEKEAAAQDIDLEQELQLLVSASPKQKLWQGAFYVPLEMQGITTEFGTIRITQEKGKYMHKAVDLIGVPKSVIWAPQNGKVILKNRYGMSGNTLVLDHGYGIFSLFYHLDDFAAGIKVGDFITKGNPIGTLGKTGYASGYHLHWEMRINNIPVDPMQWAQPEF